MKRLIAGSLIVFACAAPTLSGQVVRDGRRSSPAGAALLAAGDVQTAAAAKPWWDDRSAGLIGGIGGSIVGCLGGLIGALAGMGVARRIVLGLATGTLLFGVGCLVAGGVALGMSQPYGVYYPLLLGGVICTGVMGGLLPSLRRRYEQIELRRMAAMDVAGAGTQNPNGSL